MIDYTKIIKEKICSICVDSDAQGKCLLSDDEICAIEAYLPKILKIIKNLEDKTIDECVEVLKKEICSHCFNNSDGNCKLSKDANCALERYFPYMAEILISIEK